MTTTKTTQKKPPYRKVSVREAARLLGCSKSHCGYIRTGERKSARIASRMRMLRIKFA